MSFGRRNVEISEDEDVNLAPFGWKVNYNQRALLVRVLCSNEDKRYKSANFSQIQKVKFMTKEKSHEGPGLKFTELIINEDELFSYLSSRLDGFEKSKIEGEYWSSIVNWIEKFGFKYEKKDEVACWTSKGILKDEKIREEFYQLPRAQSRCITELGAALKSNMKNGHAKSFMQALVQSIIKSTDDLSLDDLDCLIPSSHCNTNTVLETLSGDLDNHVTQMLFNAPIESSLSNTLKISTSSLESLSEVSSEGFENSRPSKRHTIVPDFCIILPDYPGIFPIVVELKPTLEESQGISENVLQMLSKLFFQDIIFGLVVSARSYQLQVIIKTEDSVKLVRTYPILLYNLQDYHNEVCSLSLERLNSLCSFIYGALKWAKYSKCKLS